MKRNKQIEKGSLRKPHLLLLVKLYCTQSICIHTHKINYQLTNNIL